MPEIHPTPIESARLELILDGVLPGPLTVRIPPGTVGTEYGTPDEIVLVDAEGTPVASLTVTSYGEGRASGRVTPGRPREDGLFRHLRRTPDEARSELAERAAPGGPSDPNNPDDPAVPTVAGTGSPSGSARSEAVGSIGVLVLSAPPDAESVHRLARSAKTYDAVMVLPTLLPERWDDAAGPDNGQHDQQQAQQSQQNQRISAPALVRSAFAIAEDVPVPTLVVPVPLADPQRAEQVASAYGTPMNVTVSSAGAFDDKVGAIVAAEHPAPTERGAVVFFTGLSGSGKSTLARRLRDLLLERGDQRTITLLDGDVVRRHLSKGLGFSRQDRETNIDRIGYVASEIARAGGLVICAPIAPYEQGRAEARRMASAAGATFVLVHVATPLEECERRDRKGLYAKARAGELAEFTGISDPYEEPSDAELTVDTTNRAIDEVAREVLDRLITATVLTAE